MPTELAKKTAYDSTAMIPADAEQRFLEDLARHGQVALAADNVGVSRRTWYYRRARDPRFAALWDAAVEAATVERENLLLARLDDHVLALLGQSMEPMRDEETGELVLDEDFEPVFRTSIAARDLATLRRVLRREAKGPTQQVNVQVNARAAEVVTGEPIDVDELLAEIDGG